MPEYTVDAEHAQDTEPTDDTEIEAPPELDGQSTTVEEAMDAATGEEGFAHESAYTTPAGSTVIVEDTPDEDDPAESEGASARP